ncbi:hypothetical protein ALC57_19067 [Trachymyrmex cornetzi]|uniref:Pre-rRNA-processing protein Ipi1 N-terminal domain-containing protein n=1 Tax=Trachymyrmex cornetzi TaxID=471704 RepID=A0A151IQY1_9HYME|nr:hypothetical protein ALC57_19067 [Trachymyrmex cornetzi]
MYFKNFLTVRHLSCALTHIDLRMKENSLLFLDVLVQNCNSALAKDSHKILPNFLGMLSPLMSHIWLEVCPDEKVESYTKITILSETAALLKNIIIMQLIVEYIDTLDQDDYMEFIEECLEQNLGLCQIHIWFTSLFNSNEPFPKFDIKNWRKVKSHFYIVLRSCSVACRAVLTPVVSRCQDDVPFLMVNSCQIFGEQPRRTDVLLHRLHILSLRYLCTDDLVVPMLLNKQLLIFYSLSLESLYFRDSGARVTIRVQSRASSATFWGLRGDQRVSDDSFIDRHERESSNVESGRIDDGEATRYGDNSGGETPQNQETSSTQTALQTMLREMRQMREEQRRTGAAFAETQRQQNEQIFQLQERLRQIPANQLSLSNNIRGRDSFANVRVSDSLAGVFGRVDSVAAGGSVASVVDRVDFATGASFVAGVVELGNSAVPFHVDISGGAVGRFDAPPAFRGQMGVKLKPDIYEGNVPLREYLAQFNLIARANRWEDDTKTAILASCLRGRARAILENIQNLENLQFEELKSKLEMRFGETQTLQSYYSQFTNRRQKFGESIASLGSDIERLSQSAYPECSDTVRDKIAGTQFISALSDGFVKRIYKSRE